MEGVDFIVFYAVQSIYITGNVIAEQKYLNTLKVTEDHIQLFRNRCDCIVITKSIYSCYYRSVQIYVYSEKDAGPSLHSVGVNAIGFFYLPPVPLEKEVNIVWHHALMCIPTSVLNKVHLAYRNCALIYRRSEKFSPLKYFHPHTEQQKLNTQIKRHIRATLRNRRATKYF